MCATKVDDNWYGTDWADCGPDCPLHPSVFTTDNTLKVAHDNMDQNEIEIALKLFGIIASSLILIGLMVTGLSMSGTEN